MKCVDCNKKLLIKKGKGFSARRRCEECSLKHQMEKINQCTGWIAIPPDKVEPVFTVRELPVAGRVEKSCENCSRKGSACEPRPAPEECPYWQLVLSNKGEKNCGKCGMIDCALAGDKVNANQTPCLHWQPIPPDKVDDKNTCAWKWDTDGCYHTSCGVLFELGNNGTLKENNFKFCYYCGKEIKESCHSAGGEGEGK